MGSGRSVGWLPNRLVHVPRPYGSLPSPPVCRPPLPPPRIRPRTCSRHRRAPRPLTLASTPRHAKRIRSPPPWMAPLAWTPRPAPARSRPSGPRRWSSRSRRVTTAAASTSTANAIATITIATIIANVIADIIAAFHLPLSLPTTHPPTYAPAQLTHPPTSHIYPATQLVHPPHPLTVRPPALLLSAATIRTC